MTINWLFIAVALVMLCCAYYGYKKGIVRIIFSIGSLIIAIVLASVLTPYISQYLRDNTNAYAYIEEKCKEILNDSSEEEQSVAEETESDETYEEGSIQAMLEGQQLPLSLKNNIEKMSMSVENQVSDAKNAVAGSIADMALSAVCFIALLIIVRITLFIVSHVLDIVAKLPVVHGINQFAGLTFGLAEGLLIIWIFFIFLTCVLQTEFGQNCMKMIMENKVLMFLYDCNLLTLIFKI